MNFLRLTCFILVLQVLEKLSSFKMNRNIVPLVRAGHVLVKMFSDRQSHGKYLEQKEQNDSKIKLWDMILHIV